MFRITVPVMLLVFFNINARIGGPFRWRISTLLSIDNSPIHTFLEFKNWFPERLGHPERFNLVPLDRPPSSMSLMCRAKANSTVLFCEFSCNCILLKQSIVTKAWNSSHLPHCGWINKVEEPEKICNVFVDTLRSADTTGSEWLFSGFLQTIG